MNEDLKKKVEEAGFLDFNSKEIKDFLGKQESFPNFTTVKAGEARILPLARVAEATYKGTTKRALVLAVEQDGEIREASFAALYGKGANFYNRNGAVVEIPCLVPYNPAWGQGERNSAIMAAIPSDGQAVVFGWTEATKTIGGNVHNILNVTRKK